NLAAYGQRIELRIVVHKQTADRLGRLADFVWRNLPFVSHVAIMGLEPIGYARRHMDILWDDPRRFASDVEHACAYLAARGLPVSVFNYPLCVLSRSCWKYARQSISDWKNYFP